MSQVEDRAKYTKQILESDASKKLIIAGPGTGKTFTFKQVLSTCGGRGLALTFINNLVQDLEVELSEVADAYTFHGFCKSLLHNIRVDGLTSRFHYYPPLGVLISKDLEFLGFQDIDSNLIEKFLHTLDETDELISEILRIGNYYNAVGYTDSVYRVFKHFDKFRADIPRFPLIVVDEYQDFSLLESSFIRLLAEVNSVLIAGDDDQALYAFKHASAIFIRELAQDDSFTKFELPYCSRCTEVIVSAVDDILGKAKELGLLSGRIDKSYYCYLPDKSNDSQTFPEIIHAQCTVERRNAPYIGRYIAHQIEQVPVTDIQEARQNGDPTALVIGPIQFVRRVHGVLEKRFKNVVLKKSSGLEVSIVDGYLFLEKDGDSRIGWRIVLHLWPIEGIEDIINQALLDNSNLSSFLAEDYKERHLTVASLIGQIRKDEQLSDVQKELIESATKKTLEELKVLLCQTENTEIVEANTSDIPSEENINENDEPEIICTSLLGAKGLSASYVFMVGLNNGHFPLDPRAITDDEICSLLVGLSRTRKLCYMVSCDRFGNQPLGNSIFLNWIQTRLFVEKIDAKYFQDLKNK